MELVLPQISEPLKLWERIEIVVADGAEQGVYLARIEDFVEDGIVISNPQFRQGNMLLRDNCEAVVLVIKEDAVYQFYSLLSRISKEGKQLCVLTMPREVERVQRRQYVRIEVVNNIRYANLGAEDIGQEYQWFDSVCMNISGGGMLIKSSEDIEAPNVLLIESEIFNRLAIKQPVAAICRRSFHVDGQHLSGMEFIRADSLSHHFYENELARMPDTVSKFDHFAQNKLVTYIFQQQIELRKKGLI